MISEYIGRALPPSRPYLVGREKVREFALAVGEGASVCHDIDAARAAGHPDLVAPPTFGVVFTMPLMEALLRDPAFGWDYTPALVPARNTNVGAQKCVIHRVANSSGLAAGSAVGSCTAAVMTKSRT